MGKKLFLYRKSNFYKLRKTREEQGNMIVSVTKFMNDFSLIDCHLLQDLIDISSISEFNNKQSVAEQILY